ncbi:MAG: hypothetical protein WAS73_00305 [Defluviicoccus sp.]
MTPAQKALLEKRDGWGVGRDPRAVSRDELIAAGHKPMSALKALRLRCIDCKAGELSEVRRCAHLDCPSWPYRMGRNVWSHERSEAQQQHTCTLTEKRRAGAENQPSGRHEIAKPAAPATTLPAEPSVRPGAQRERAFQTQATLSVEDAR